MRKVRILPFALAVALSFSAAQAGDKLKDLEMDVMQPEQTPEQAASKIQLPGHATGQGQGQDNPGQGASDARDNAGANGQSVAEQAQSKHDKRKPANPGHGHGHNP
jgi:hypothetical protein